MDVVGESSRPGSARPLSRIAAFEQDDDEGEDGFGRLGDRASGHGNGREEALSGFSRSRGAEKVNRSPPRQGPRVITKQDNLNWMEERKRRLGLNKYRAELGSLSSMSTPGGGAVAATPTGSSSLGIATATAERIGDEEQLSGLQIRQRGPSRDEEEMEEIRRLQEAAAQSANGGGGGGGDETPSASQAGHSPPLNGRSAEEQEEDAARRALLSGQPLGSTVRAEERVIAISEEEALKRDTESRPDAPTMSDYANMPVEEFGAALLRGMGWKQGMGAGKNRQGPTSAPEVKKRAALLGLGARERQLEEEQGKDKRRSYAERRYVPVSRRDNGPSQSSSSSPAPSRHHRDRSRSPSRRSHRDRDYSRRDEHSRDDGDYERERRRRREREREYAERGDSHHSSSSRDRIRRP